MNSEAATDPVILALTGMLPAVLIAAAALAFVVSLLLLKLYRRAVLRSMNERGGGKAPTSPEPAAGAASPNRRHPNPVARLLQVERISPATLRSLLACLLLPPTEKG